MAPNKTRISLNLHGAVRYLSLLLVTLVLLGTLAACGSAAPATAPNDDHNAADPVEDPQTDPVEALPYEGKKVLWIDAYHQGYGWSDAIHAGLLTVFNGTGVEFELFRMDTKNITDSAEREQMAQQAYEKIQSFNPDVVIACEDNAQKFLVVPYLKDTGIPVVFCGVNWDASGYGYPASNVTGMVEVEFPIETFENLRTFANGDRIGYLSGDTSTDQKVADIMNERFFDGELQIQLVTTFDQWKSAFVQMQTEVDMLYVRNNAGIDGWDDAEAEAFVLENAKVPSSSPQTYMAPYVLMVLGKLGEEHGVWSAETALSLLDGATISSIPMTENVVVQVILNMNVANQLGVEFPPEMLRNADIYGLEEASE